MAAVQPSLPGAAPPGSVASTAAVVVMVLVVISVVMVEDALEVTLVTPPAPATVEEGRETGLPASPDGV